MGVSGVRVYKNSETGTRINKPDNWKVSFNERNGLIVITAKEGFWKHDSARIEIFAGTCPISPATSDSFSTPLNELLQQDIERIGKLYNQESVSILQEPIKIDNAVYEVEKAIISIPTMSMFDDSARIQVGDPKPDKAQTIVLYAFRDSKRSVLAYMYTGNSETLNIQAKDIVESVRWACGD